MTVRILIGDVREQLATLPDESVHMCCTSPPYFGLRDYGTAQWEGGDAGCAHKKGFVDSRDTRSTLVGTTTTQNHSQESWGDFCRRCGARRIDRQIGLESSPAEYVEAMVSVFREVRRVLRKDGTLWLNIGDSYSAHPGQRKTTDNAGAKQQSNTASVGAPSRCADGCKPKDLIGIPWMLAFALRDDGWWLRSDIIWSKPNPMPESITDRPTKAHEYLFLLAKSERYYYDADAIAEPAAKAGQVLHSYGTGAKDRQDVSDTNDRRTRIGLANWNRACPETRNKRSVWTVATAPYSEAHFATFPPALIEPCILAGCPEKVCAKCGAPWARGISVASRPNWQGDGQKHDGTYYRPNPGGGVGNDRRPRTVGGLEPTCNCALEYTTAAGTVLDPFFGAGTTGLVADRLRRDCIGIELSPAYAEMARRRIEGDAGLFAEVAAE